MSDGAASIRVRTVFLGAPGAGKGTQAKMLADRRGLLHVSTGDMLREHLAAGTELGRRAKGFMDAGDLVPDDLIIAMVEDRLRRPDAQGSWVLDGFPRTLPQAEALDASLARAGTPLTHVVYFVVPEETLVRRLGARRTCGQCGAIWNTESKPPAKEGVCDLCGGTLEQRRDDRPEAVRNRLEVYRRDTEPVLGHYRSSGMLSEIDADRPAEDVHADLQGALVAGGAA